MCILAADNFAGSYEEGCEAFALWFWPELKESRHLFGRIKPDV